MHIRKVAMGVALVLVAACSKEEAKHTVTAAKEKVADTLDVATPVGKDDTAGREQQRLDEQWRQLQSFRAQQAAQQAQQQQQAQLQQQQQQAAAAANFTFVERTKKTKETFKGLDANAINAAPIVVPVKGDILGPSVLKAQVYLDRAHFSVGSLDGRWGRNSAISTWWFQRANGLPETGDVDEATFRALGAAAGAPPALTQYTVTADDLKGPFVKIPEDVYEKEKLSCLCYETAKEELAEKFHTTEDFLDQLNPEVKFSELHEGQTLVMPNVRPPMSGDQPDIAKVVISISGNSFNAWDSAGRLIFHAPTTVGSKYDPSPDETVKVVAITHNPNFHYQPTLFHEVPDSDPEAHLKPGPNSPVGVVWMALSKEHFGVHGTSDPDSIGYASSHGCVRLTNWDADEVSHRIAKDVPVSFVDTRRKSD